jgi:hypothetical protein
VVSERVFSLIVCWLQSDALSGTGLRQRGAHAAKSRESPRARASSRAYDEYYPRSALVRVY